MPDLIVFHYHLLTGGVTTVILKGISAIRGHLPEIRRIRLVTGQKAGTQALARALGVEVQTWPAISYLDTADRDPRQLSALAGSMAERLKAEYASPSTIWWIHNFHLGKNPCFTEALLRIIHSGYPQKMILQIHDFPENGRLPGLLALSRAVRLPLYPDSPHVHYAVINERDRRALVEAGLPASRVTLLPNPINEAAADHPAADTGERQAIRRQLAAGFPSRSAAFSPEAPMIIYPIRTIRRKNVLEAGLITRLLEGPVNLLVSLPGLSRQEIVYSSLVEQCFREGLIPGLWGIGEELEEAGLSFERVVRGSDLVMSTAIQEGFGYLFINALQWGLPLAARALDTLEGFDGLFQGYPAFFYSRFRCPLLQRDREVTRRSYARKLKMLSCFLPPEHVQVLRRKIGDLLREELFEFSYLSSEVQYRVLKLSGSRSYMETLRQANRELLERIAGLLREPPRPAAAGGSAARAVQEQFGYARYCRVLQSILQELGGQPEGGGPGPAACSCADSEAVIRRFARPEALRLLYD